MNIRTDILLRTYTAFGLIVLFALAVVAKLVHVQFVEYSKWQSMAALFSTKFVNIEAARGNIYSRDGRLLATSIPEYELRMDMLAAGIEENSDFYDQVDLLSARLAAYFKDKSAAQYSHMLRDARHDSLRFFLIRRGVSYQELKEIRTFPIFNAGRYRGGLIAIAQNKRILPFKSLAARTIGYKKKNVQAVGLEGAYASYLDGEYGKRLMQRIAGAWMPVNQDIEFTSKDGADIISTIDINIQDIAERALEKQLLRSDADHGCVVLMEVHTGEVRAIANLTKGKDGQYQERFNYAIAESAEPASTFKLASYMVLLDKHHVDTNTLVDCENGKFKLYDHIIQDTHLGNRFITVKKAFAESSNVAIVKLLRDQYKSRPNDFIDALHKLHLNEKLNLQIPGEGDPLIKNPKDKYWSGLTLAQMAYGYEVMMTPLQMLAFYNAVANHGKMIAPIFVKEIRRFGNTIAQFQARVINEKICTDATLAKLQKMLEGVMKEGDNGYDPLKNSPYQIAGKTGTAQIANGTLGYKDNKSYQASFCGYFPANDPKYAMIVVLNSPKGAYYSSLIAVPVFREIANHVYANDVQMFDQIDLKLANQTKKRTPQFKLGHKRATEKVYQALGIKNNSKRINNNDDISDNGIPYTAGVVPNVVGMGLKDALFLVGNAGLKPSVNGCGTVIKQSIHAGFPISRGQRITLELQ